MYIFAFKNTIAEKIARNLPQDNVYYLNGRKESIDRFLDHLLAIKPKKILGLGSYSGIDKKKIRIETICKNKFRNNRIFNNQIKQFDINYFVAPSEKLKLSSGSGNSYCNLVSALIMNAIRSNKLESQYTFLHIPKTFDSKMALVTIQEII
jgi:pyrrolidone-carboxylate peptidase